MTSLSNAGRILTERWDAVYEKNPLHMIPWQSDTPEPLLVEAVEKGELRPTAVLDMCSGAGTNSIYLAGKGFDVHGIDISPEAVRIAKHACQKKGLTCDYRVGDVLTYPEERSFGLVFDRGCFHHLSKKERTRYIKKVSSLLEPGGAFFLQCFSDRNPPFWKNFSKAELEKMFSPDFKISYIKDSIHLEPDTGTPRYLYTSFMKKKEGLS